MKPAERKKLKEAVRKRRLKETQELYNYLYNLLTQIDRVIKQLIKTGHTKEEAIKIVRKRIFGHE